MSKPSPCANGHNYFPLKVGYHKLKPGREVESLDSTIDSLIDGYDNQVSYSMLCCRRCGATMEVVAADLAPGN